MRATGQAGGRRSERRRLMAPVPPRRTTWTGASAQKPEPTVALAEPSDDVPIQRRIWASGLSEDAKRLVERVLLRAVNVREAETMTNHMKLESESVKVIIA
jgi:hypothetical protein